MVHPVPLINSCFLYYDFMSWEKRKYLSVILLIYVMAIFAVLYFAECLKWKN